MNNFTSAALFALLTLCSSAFAQDSLQTKEGKAIPLGSTHFPARPISCEYGYCPAKPPKLIVGDICVVAICQPLKAQSVTKILGPDVMHWRIQKSKGTMAQFLGDIQLTTPVKAQAPSVLATRSDVKQLPIIGMKNAKNEVVQYWVVVK